MQNWTPSNIFDARNRMVQERNGHAHSVTLDERGWNIGAAEGMDIWSACRMLNNMDARVLWQSESATAGSGGR